MPEETADFCAIGARFVTGQIHAMDERRQFGFLVCAGVSVTHCHAWGKRDARIAPRAAIRRSSGVDAFALAQSVTHEAIWSGNCREVRTNCRWVGTLGGDYGIGNDDVKAGMS